VVEITVEVTDPHQMAFPAPTVAESTIIYPTTVDVPPVHVGKVITDEL
jgi:hypothetical protein